MVLFLFTSMLASHTVTVCCREILSVCEHVPKLSEFAGRRPTLSHESNQASRATVVVRH